MMVFMPVISTFAIAELLTINNIKLFGTTLQENIYNGMWNYGAALSLVMLVLIRITSLLNKRGQCKSCRGRRIDMTKKILASSYLGLLLVMLYAPILIIIVFSFTEAKVLGNWTGFSLKLYTSLFQGGVTPFAFRCAVEHPYYRVDRRFCLNHAGNHGRHWHL